MSSKDKDLKHTTVSPEIAASAATFHASKPHLVDGVVPQFDASKEIEKPDLSAWHNIRAGSAGKAGAGNPNHPLPTTGEAIPAKKPDGRPR